MRIGTALRDLERSERGLAHGLEHLADRHRAEHEVCHVAHDLAGWSRVHAADVAAAAGRYEDPPETAAGPGEGLGRALGGTLAGVLDDPLAELGAPVPDVVEPGTPATDGLALLRDLRLVAMHAYGVSTEWEMVAQAAQAVRDHDLLTLCQRYHPGTLRQLRWANATIKVLSTQALTS
ncbi:hypothetical protein ACH436_05880 [Isoptericola sp. NPDC019693]|uniref:hypothetical protein n=1 Tax=Isoptericola sp. NPDC019693 TaxID=3364009 RepID=UPI00378D8283